MRAKHAKIEDPRISTWPMEKVNGFNEELYPIATPPRDDYSNIILQLAKDMKIKVNVVVKKTFGSEYRRNGCMGKLEFTTSVVLNQLCPFSLS